MSRELNIWVVEEKCRGENVGVWEGSVGWQGGWQDRRAGRKASN
jgi:hypothetical protein